MEENTNTNQTSTVQTPNVPSRRKENKAKPFLIGLIVLAFVLIVGGFIYYLGTRGEEAQEPSPTPSLITIEDNFTPTPTPVEEDVDKKTLSVQILNGTGIEREASFLQTRIKNLGFEEIEVGNADDTDNKATTVTFSSSIPQSLQDEVTSELEGIYESVTTKIGSTGDFDIAIVTGLRKGQTAKPAATSTPKPTTTASSSTSTPTSTSTSTPTPTASN